jgi:hypothetical protein
MKPWFGLTILLGLFAVPRTQSLDFGDDDKLFTLVLLQMITNNNDPNAMQSLYPLLLTSIMGDDNADTSNAMYYLLLGAGDDERMQEWLPLILNNGEKSTSDKLLMLIFMQRNRVVADTGMNSMFPLHLLNANDKKFCQASGGTCTCEEDNSEMLLYTMLLNSRGVGGQNEYTNFMYLLFDDDSCKGSYLNDDPCTCDEVEGGIDAVTWMLMMQMAPQAVNNNLPERPPQRAIDVKSLLKQQLFSNLGPEMSWMMNFQGADTQALMKFQMATQMGIPPDVLTLLESKGSRTDEERFALIQWMSQGSNLSIETMSLMLGIEDAKQFYIQSMIENGSVDPLTASLMLASQGNVGKEKMKELLIMAATNPNINPDTFATITRPYVPTLPEGIFPGQDLYFIHIEMLELNTCAFVEPEQRKPCMRNMGSFVTAEQCEVYPYCCYNPYIGEDSVPWCYYNIFFVFHDQYRLRVKEADQFKGPQDCPGLFRYGIELDPFMYFQAANQILSNHQATIGNYEYTNVDVASNAASPITKLQKLIHLRRDMGFPGITEFHCRAIKGSCWDPNAASYPAQYNIPQCYEEEVIGNADDNLNLYDPELFKPVVPEQFRAQEGECDTNYFHISTLYYERRACTFDIDMIRYGHEYHPLRVPTKEDCIFRLGCCWEESDDIMDRYNFMPRCYKRVTNELEDDRLFQMTKVTDANDCGTVANPTACANVANSDSKICGQEVVAFIDNHFAAGSAERANIKAYNGRNIDDIFGYFAASAIANADLVNGIPETIDDYCLFHRRFLNKFPKSCNSPDKDDSNCQFWNLFDLFNREKVRADSERFSGIPADLRDMVDDIF